MSDRSSCQTTVLIVEDNQANFALLNEIMLKEGYRVLNAWNGEEGLTLLNAKSAEIDVILLDLMLPKIDGCEFLKIIRQEEQYDNIPVIVQSADRSEKALQKVTSYGAYFFLAKPIDISTCCSVVKNALDDARRFDKALRKANRRELSFSLMKKGEFFFKTEEEALTLAASLSKICPSPRKQLIGLSELMINAIEHGNLAIDQKQKQEFIEADSLDQEIKKRLASAEYGARQASIHFFRDEEGITFVISDEGAGFDWRQELLVISEKMMLPSRRGIALAHKIAFDKVIYSDIGNEVTAFAKALADQSSPSVIPREAYTENLPFRSAKPLVTANNMQKRYLPSDEYLELFKSKFQLDFSFFYRPSEELGGDHWGAIALNDEQVALFIIDYASEGAEAAAETIWLDGAIWNLIEYETRPHRFLSTLNNCMIKRSSTNSYATMLFGVLDIKGNTFTYATAGAPLPVALCSNPAKAIMGTGKGLPLGAVPNAQYNEDELTIGQHDTLLLYSDGIVENPNTANEIVGRAQAAAYFENISRVTSSPLTAQHVLASFLHDTSQPPNDDTTLVCISRF